MLRYRRSLDANTTITDKLFQDIVSESLRQLHGYIGGALQIDLLLLTQAVATIRVDKRYGRHVTSPSCLGKGPYNTQPRYSIASFRDWDKLWSALTLLTYYNGVKCRIEASPPVTLQLTGSRG